MSVMNPGRAADIDIFIHTEQPIRARGAEVSVELVPQAYGHHSRPSFLHQRPHHSLKIPPKKRRRFSKSFRPLSHGSPLSVQVYKSGRDPSPNLSILLHIYRTQRLSKLSL
ncbi:hypothetical protein MHYP_G00338300 [Metynnis hypsauchen]